MKRVPLSTYTGSFFIASDAELRKETLTIRNGNITFNTACINGLEDVIWVNLMIDQDAGLLAVQECDENDKHALRWCIAKPDKRKSRKMTCPGFTDLLYSVMDWDKNCRYKMLKRSQNRTD